MADYVFVSCKWKILNCSIYECSSISSSVHADNGVRTVYRSLISLVLCFFTCIKYADACNSLIYALTNSVFLYDDNHSDCDKFTLLRRPRSVCMVM